MKKMSKRKKLFKIVLLQLSKTHFSCLQKSNNACYYENGICISCKLGYTLDTSSESTCIPKNSNQNVNPIKNNTN